MRSVSNTPGQKELPSGWLSLLSVGLVSTHVSSLMQTLFSFFSQKGRIFMCKALTDMLSAGAGNDYQKDKQFRKLNEKKDLLDVKMIRGGSQILVPNPQIVVGDVIILQTGDKITADGIVIESNNMVVDEASLTGESEPIKKGSKDMFCRAGTTVCHFANMSNCALMNKMTGVSCRNFWHARHSTCMHFCHH